jgi:hypothetical protein
LDSNDLDLFGQPHSASENPSPKPSSESTGPTSPSTTTLEPSPPTNSEQLMLSAGDFHASRGPLPGSKEAQKMTEISGRSWLPLLKNYGLGGSLGKMCEVLLTSRWASNAAFLTWKVSDTKPRHLLFQLAPSMPRTEGIASGLWPTPRSFTAMAANITEKTTRPDGYRGNLEEVVARTMWPTPTTRDHKGGRKPEALEASGRGETNTLNDAVTIRDQHGALNPEWVCWLMGFPAGWTNLTLDELQPELKTRQQD